MPCRPTFFDTNCHECMLVTLLFKVVRGPTTLPVPTNLKKEIGCGKLVMSLISPGFITLKSSSAIGCLMNPPMPTAGIVCILDARVAEALVNSMVGLTLTAMWNTNSSVKDTWKSVKRLGLINESTRNTYAFKPRRGTIKGDK